MSQALYRKWRPTNWDEIVGQQHIVQTIRNAVAAGRFGHAYLFAGPRGTGKTTLARILAKALNCTHDDLSARPDETCANCEGFKRGNYMDMIEIDAASNTSVDDVRSLRDKINFSPSQGQYKVYIIDEVHMLSTAAFNALLKTLEEPPPHAIFVLATTEVHKIPATVLSRCQRHEFRRISVSDIVGQLQKIAAGENIKIDSDAMTLVARQAAGGMRDAISLLDQLSSAGGKITHEMTQGVLGTATSQSVLDVVTAVRSAEAGAGLDHLQTTLDAGTDPRQFARQIVDYLRGVLLVSMGNAAQVDTTKEELEKMAQHAQGFESSELLRIIKVFNQAAVNARGVWQPSLPLELAIVESIVGPEAVPAAPVAAQTSAPAAPAQLPSQAQPQQPKKAPPKKQPQQVAGLKKEEWQAVVAHLRAEAPSLQALLSSSSQREFKNNTLRIGFVSDQLKTLMEKEDNIKMLIESIKNVTGRTIQVEVMVSAKGGALPDGVDEDSRAGAAVRLGGKIVDINDLDN